MVAPKEKHDMQACDNWTPARCTRPGEVRLICPDGKPCPCGPFCLTCAQACVDEYREKLGEGWSYREAQP